MMAMSEFLYYKAFEPISRDMCVLSRSRRRRLCHGRRAHLAQEPNRQERNPAPADDDRDALEQASRRVRENAVLIEYSRGETCDEGHHADDPSHERVGAPATP